ncbi:thioredoxin-like protein [Suhomyces tanzawaensis NRRL Y-17324]|uniref:Thioredoxin-like protein n=1 Tax=Suhomyces tanzawaensis NRRL Y-17324 TaxID=984487 RepID=A0A1E4SGT3_9ASCO|nr:thioredoxin-like protein [Suhomyces tanzawaensis NRRL Y-17324]ODV78696.1 thioredoxin-like protein [Suhomyces tanzawaensis NRRL Y-17324]
MIFKNLLFFLHLWVLAAARALGDEYASDPNIYELTPSNFDKVVHSTNYTTIVKFYAPWCGYCQQLKPVYTRLARLMHRDGQYAINVASVNCDKDSNKALCAKYQVQGFPTLLVFRPPKHVEGKKRAGKHATETYNGERNIKAMSSFLTSRLKNYVKKFPNLKGDVLKQWFKKDGPKLFLISNNAQISPMLKSLAIDFIDTVNFGMTSIKGKTVKDVIEVNGKELEIDTAVPALFYYDEANNALVKYDKTEKLNDKKSISQWIMDVTGHIPLEGSLSKKDKRYYSYYRLNKKVPKKKEYDEL